MWSLTSHDEPLSFDIIIRMPKDVREKYLEWTKLCDAIFNEHTTEISVEEQYTWTEAEEFLKEKGYNISEQVKIDFGDHYYIVDMVGEKDNERVAMEVGSVRQKGKIYELCLKFDKVYHLPYRETVRIFTKERPAPTDYSEYMNRPPVPKMPPCPEIVRLWLNENMCKTILEAEGVKVEWPNSLLEEWRKHGYEK